VTPVGRRIARGFARRAALTFEGSVDRFPALAGALVHHRVRELERRWTTEACRASVSREVANLWPNRHSQNDEDAILAELFRRLGTTGRFFVEIGASDGMQNCTRNLAEHGWRGVWIEGDPVAAQRARALALEGVEVITAGVDPSNVVALLHQVEVPPEPDLVVLDIDGNDWWVLQSLLGSFTPRVLVAEYNATFQPGQWWVFRYRPNRAWDHTFRHGASLDALDGLLGDAGYRLVGCDRNGVNAFFVHGRALSEGLACSVGSPAVHYTAPWFSALPYGHVRSRRAVRPMLALSRAELSRIEVSHGERLGPPEPVAPGAPVFIRVRIRNGTGVPLTSGPPAAVNLSPALV
jgi:hypothetical protein